MVNFYTVTKEIGGKEIKAQFNGISAGNKAIDNSYIDGSSNISLEKLSKYILENVIVEPRMRFEDFGADKIGAETTKEIGGVEYVAKFGGVLTAIRAVDTSYIDGTENTSVEKFSKYLFDKVIVKPKKLTADDFETQSDFNEVVAFARETMQGGDIWNEFQEIIAFGRKVMQGDFREEKDRVPTRTGSKE